MFAVIAAVLMVGLLSLRGWIVGVMDTPTEAVEGMKNYLTVCFIGIPFIIAYNIIASIFRGLGDFRDPMYFVAVACVVNIALDYLFIGLPFYWIIWIRRNGRSPWNNLVANDKRALCHHFSTSPSDISRSDLQPRKDVIKNILKIGVPIAMQDGFIQISFLAITVIANQRGLIDAAAVGIVEKFIGLVFIVPSAMLSTVSAISAQNIGAGNMERAKRTMRTAMMITTCYGEVCAVVLQFIPHLAVGIFTDNLQVLAQGSDYLRGYVWDCIFAGIHFCFSGFFTACGFSIISFIHNSISIVCARIPLAWLSSNLYPDSLYPMGLSTCTGSVMSCLICVGAYWWMNKRMITLQTH